MLDNEQSIRFLELIWIESRSFFPLFGGVLGIKYKVRELRINVYVKFWRNRPLDNEWRWRRIELNECVLLSSYCYCVVVVIIVICYIICFSLTLRLLH